MDFKRIIWITLILSGNQQLDAQTVDSLKLSNGMVFWGTLNGISNRQVQFGVQNASQVSVGFGNIQYLSGRQRYYRIQTTDGRQLFGRIEPGDTAGEIYVDLKLIKVRMPLTAIHSAVVVQESFLSRWGWGLASGYTYTRSTDIGRWNFDSSTRYRGQRVEGDLNGSLILTNREGDWVRERENLSLQANYLLGVSWFATVNSMYQRNQQLGIGSRFQQRAGLGYRLTTINNFRLLVGSGLAYSSERGIGETDIRRLYELPLATELEFRLPKYRLTFATTQNFFAGLTQRDRFRNDGETRIKWGVIANFELSLMVFNNFDTQPLAAGNSSDYGVVFGISYRIL
jgi:hypothetical protein